MVGVTEKKERAPRRRGRKGKDGTNAHSFSPAAGADGDHHQDLDALSYKQHKTLLIHLTESTPTWYECGRGTASRDDTLSSVSRSRGGNKTKRTNPHHLVTKYRKLADSIYHQEVTLFRTNSSSKDEQWVENTMKRGTLKDRIAAMSVVVSSNPVHKLYALDMLLNLAGVSSEGGHSGQTNERVSGMAAEALTDLFTSTLLPKHRKLVGLESRPLYQYEETQNNTKKSISPRILLLWRYEEIVKSKYAAFLDQYLRKTLSQTATSAESLSKVSALRTACSLLKEIPEGEQVLLNMIVNKLGDPTKKIAAAAGHELRRILETHPNMTNVVAREVQQLAHRPNLSTKALYNCIIFLNQLKLVKEEETPAEKSTEDSVSQKKGSQGNLTLPASLINTYFEIFEVAIKKTKHGEGKKKKSNSQMDQAMKSRLLGALLTGVNRAHPYLPLNDTGMEKHIDSLYKISHVAPPSACTQAFMLLFHLAVGSNHKDEESPLQAATKDVKSENARKDRFYRALYSKLSDPTMLFGRQLTLFFNLIYKAMKYDTNSTRLVAFGKRLLHVAFHYNPAVVSGAIFLLSEVMKNQPALSKSVFTNDGNMMKFDYTKREPSAAFDPVIINETKNGEENDIISSAETETDSGSLWEMSLTLHHYHPSVCKFASDVGDIQYNGDPLRDFALAPFLDKFAFRNPKSAEKIMNKVRRGESVGERKNGLKESVKAMTSLPMNDPKFWAKNKNVSEQEEFFQKFFVERAKRDNMKGVDRSKQDDELEPEADAIDPVEGKDVDFDWEDTDEEEEQFVQSLAEGLMKSAGGENYDEEDPDMDDWSDYGGSDDDDSAALEGEVGDFAEMDGLDHAEAASDEENAAGNNDSDSDDDFGVAFVGDLDDDDDGIEEDDESQAKKTSDNDGKKMPSSSFASAVDYAKRIDAAWEDRQSRKRSNSEVSLDEEATDVPKSDKKKKRRKKKNKKVTN